MLALYLVTSLPVGEATETDLGSLALLDEREKSPILGLLVMKPKGNTSMFGKEGPQASLYVFFYS